LFAYTTISHIVTPRKNFLPSEIAAIAKALRPVAEEEAKERAEEGRVKGRMHRWSGATFPKPEEKTRAPRVRDKVASFAGVSGRTLEKIVEIVKERF